MLHGSGGDAQHGLSLIKCYADESNVILLAPVSRDYSWDIITSGTFGPDVIYIDQALAQIFEDYTIDSSRMAIGGFSDGASYALSLGLTNGDLFTHVMAFSPSFAHAEYITGKPEIFISHGINDHILPINSCGRKIVKHLQRSGYAPIYQEFGGEHLIPVYISKMALEWFF
jgi:predicted esterase